jgi:spermidine synthase
MKTLELLGEALAPDGTALKLVRRDEEYLILASGAVLMSSRIHGSEEELARLACERLEKRKRAKVLVGGLGMGFTLRATLDLLAADATVTVAELIPAVVTWNGGILGALAGHPLQDRRVRVETCDVQVVLGTGVGKFDALLLDVDNGPAALTASGNAGLYERSGIAAAYAALKADGVLAVWAANEDARFAQRLRDGGFEVEVRQVRGRTKKGGPRHTIFLGVKGRSQVARNGAPRWD